MPRVRCTSNGLRALAAGAVLATALTALAACSGGSDAVNQTNGGDFRFVGATSKGTTIPAKDRRTTGDVTGTLLSGGTFSLKADRGKVVVLNFWASWCGPCKVETPELSKLSTALAPRGVQFVGLDVKDDKGSAQDFVTQNDITYPMVFDQPARTALQLGRVPVQALPSTVVIDKQGRVAAVYEGAVQPADLEPAVTALLAEQ